MAPMTADRKFTIDTLRALIRIDSRNPGLEEGSPGETEIAEYVRGVLSTLGWSSERFDFGDRRANVVAFRKGIGDGPSLMLNVHLDTVGVGGMDNPFEPILREGRIYGRGAHDVKGGVAAALAVARALSEEDVTLHGDLILAFVADEEHESTGTTNLVRRVTADAAIVLEPTDLDLCVAHRGYAVYRLMTRGHAVHGGCSEQGVDANVHMGHLLVELDRLRLEWEENHRHPMLGSASLHVPLISGGRQLFIYADECESHLECRTVPGQSSDDVLVALETILDNLRQRVETFDGSVELLQWRDPWEIDPGHFFVRTAKEIVEQVRGEPVRLISHPWWEDSALLGSAGMPTIVVGPVGGGLHTSEEWVDPDSVVFLAEILYRIAMTFCRVAVTNGDDDER